VNYSGYNLNGHPCGGPNNFLIDSNKVFLVANNLETNWTSSCSSGSFYDAETGSCKFLADIVAVRWTDSSGGIVDSKICNNVASTCNVYPTVLNSGLSVGSGITLGIYKKRLLLSDQLIRTVSAVVSSSGSANASWNILFNYSGIGNYSDIYFKIEDYEISSSDLEIQVVSNLYDVSVCSDYGDEDSCEDDSVGVAQSSVNDSDDCGEIIDGIYYECYCSWDDSEDSCDGTKSSIAIPSGTILEIPDVGICSYSSTGSDDCSDGILEYSWVSNFVWDEDNVFTNLASCKSAVGSENCISVDGKYHYDPNSDYDSCKNGSRRVACPAQVQVPFFY
jgi:hypothetical protein